MKRRKRSNEQTQLDQLFDDLDEAPNYIYQDEDTERRIAKFERDLEHEDIDDLGWGIFKTY